MIKFFEFFLNSNRALAALAALAFEIGIYATWFDVEMIIGSTLGIAIAWVIIELDNTPRRRLQKLINGDFENFKKFVENEGLLD